METSSPTGTTRRRMGEACQSCNQLVDYDVASQTESPEGEPGAPCARPACETAPEELCRSCFQRNYCSQACYEADRPRHKQVPDDQPRMGQEGVVYCSLACQEDDGDLDYCECQKQSSKKPRKTNVVLTAADVQMAALVTQQVSAMLAKSKAALMARTDSVPIIKRHHIKNNEWEVSIVYKDNGPKKTATKDPQSAGPCPKCGRTRNRKRRGDKSTGGGNAAEGGDGKKDKKEDVPADKMETEVKIDAAK